MNSIDEAKHIHKKRFISVFKKINTQVYIWSLRVNIVILGSFQKGWIEVQGVPFHLWVEKHLLQMVDGCGKVIEIDYYIIKLVDLSNIHQRMEVRENVVIPAKVTHGAWIFTATVALFGEGKILQEANSWLTQGKNKLTSLGHGSHQGYGRWRLAKEA